MRALQLTQHMTCTQVQTSLKTRRLSGGALDTPQHSFSCATSRNAILPASSDPCWVQLKLCCLISHVGVYSARHHTAPVRPHLIELAPGSTRETSCTTSYCCIAWLSWKGAQRTKGLWRRRILVGGWRRLCVGAIGLCLRLASLGHGADARQQIHRLTCRYSAAPSALPQLSTFTPCNTFRILT